MSLEGQSKSPKGNKEHPPRSGVAKVRAFAIEEVKGRGLLESALTALQKIKQLEKEARTLSKSKKNNPYTARRKQLEKVADRIADFSEGKIPTTMAVRYEPQRIEEGAPKRRESIVESTGNLIFGSRRLMPITEEGITEALSRMEEALIDERLDMNIRSWDDPNENESHSVYTIRPGDLSREEEEARVLSVESDTKSESGSQGIEELEVPRELAAEVLVGEVTHGSEEDTATADNTETEPAQKSTLDEVYVSDTDQESSNQNRTSLEEAGKEVDAAVNALLKIEQDSSLEYERAKRRMENAFVVFLAVVYQERPQDYETVQRNILAEYFRGIPEQRMRMQYEMQNRAMESAGAIVFEESVAAEVPKEGAFQEMTALYEQHSLQSFLANEERQKGRRKQFLRSVFALIFAVGVGAGGLLMQYVNKASAQTSRSDVLPDTPFSDMFVADTPVIDSSSETDPQREWPGLSR